MSFVDCSYEVEQVSCERAEAWDLVCLIVDRDHQLSDIDTVEWPMAAMDMP
ncbi:hypothetical protein A2U01_0100414, partial [Trifolium medium]|nr:hypothetical protein [Trifolium medium]